MNSRHPEHREARGTGARRVRYDWTGRTVLVTGAAHGIGRAIAAAALGAGARVVIGDIDADALTATTAALRAEGGEIVGGVCDVRRSADIDALVALATTSCDAPDIVYANAGIEGPLGEPWECDEAEFMRVLDINVMGIWRTMRAVLPRMVARSRGAIVATSSVGGLVGAAGLAPYVTSKHAVVGLVKSVAAGVAARGVRVNALCPGMVETDMVGRLVAQHPPLRAAMLARQPIGRLAEVAEIARIALWLGSDDASFVTGHALAADGGYLAQ